MSKIKMASGSYYTMASTSTDDNNWLDSSYISFDGTGDVSKVEIHKTKPKPEIDYKSKSVKDLIDDISANLRIDKPDSKIAVGIFCKYKSDIDNDSRCGLFNGYYYHMVYPIQPDSTMYERIYLLSYDICVITDVLEYLPSKMARANAIKEALIALCINRPRYLIIMAKSEKEVEEARKTDSSIITGFSVEELKSLALFAGAKEIIEPDFVKDKDLKDQYIIVTNC